MKEHRINPRFTDEEYEQIVNAAALKGCSLSQLVRENTLKGIEPDVLKENINFLCGIIRQEIKNTQQPEFDRLATLVAKTCIMSATGAFLNAETIMRFVPYEKQSDVKEVYDAARIKAVEYIKTRSKE